MFNDLFLCMGMSMLSTGVHGGQEHQASLELKLHTVVSHKVWVLGTKLKGSEELALYALNH